MIIELKANGAEKMEVRYDPEKELMLKEFHWRPYICRVKQAGGVIRAVITGVQSWGTKSSWETLFTSYLHAGGFLRPNQKTSKPKTENVDFFFFPRKSLVEKVEIIETEIQMEKKQKHLSGHLSLSWGLLTWEST